MPDDSFLHGAAHSIPNRKPDTYITKESVTKISRTQYDFVVKLPNSLAFCHIKRTIMVLYRSPEQRFEHSPKFTALRFLYKFHDEEKHDGPIFLIY